MTLFQKFSFFIVKRVFDIAFSIIVLSILWPVIIVSIAVAKFDSGATGIFSQVRVGKNRKLFNLYKIRTMRNVTGTTITTSKDSRITSSGRIFRRSKLDELPQFWNVLIGDMSIVGPRPDVVGYADLLTGESVVTLLARPGITGPASIKYRNEEEILAKQENPVAYNDKIIWPDKVNINMEYVKSYSFLKDIKYIVLTVV